MDGTRLAATDGHSAVASVISLLLSCECVSFADAVSAGFLIVFMIWSADKGSLRVQMLLMLFRGLGKFVLYTMSQFTQLYN